MRRVASEKEAHQIERRLAAPSVDLTERRLLRGLAHAVDGQIMHAAAVRALGAVCREA